MSRTQIVLDSKNNQQSSKIIEEILNSHKFEMVSKKDEDYWQQGIGVTQAPKFIKYYFDGDKLILEGWVSNLGRESDLGGVVGALPKKSVKKILDEITDAIEKANKESAASSAVSKVDDKKANKESAASSAVSKVDDNADDDVNLETLTDDLFKYLDDNPASTSSKVNKTTTNVSNPNVQKSKGIIPRRFRGGPIYNVFEVIIGILYFIGASSGYLVLRFTDSSEALMVVAVIFIIHGGLSLISHMQDQ